MGGKKQEKSSAEQGISQAGATAYARSQATPQETGQYSSSFDLGKILEQIMRYQQGLGGAPSGYQIPESQYTQQLGPLGQQYYQTTLADVQDPYRSYESTLQPQLKLAEDFINRGAQQRGLLRSGIPIEQLGRAGVDLAIAEANQRMQYRNQALGRGAGLQDVIQGYGQQNLQNLGSLYGQQQQLGQQSMGRQAGAAQNAAQYQAYPYQAQLGNYYGQQGQLGAGIGGGLGTLGGFAVGAALAPATGGASLMYPLLGAGLGGAAGSQLGRSIF